MRANRIIARIHVRYWEWSRVRGASRPQVLSTSPQPVLLTHLRNDSCSRVDGAGRGGGSRDSQPPQGWCRVRMLVLAKVEGQ